MGEGKKIVDLRREDADAATESELGTASTAEKEQSSVNDSGQTDASDAPMALRTPPRITPATVLILALGAAWTGFYGWMIAPAALAGLTPSAFASHVAQWAMPLALLCMGYLALQRNGSREVRRYAYAAQLLRSESAALEARLESINNELSLAREFLANQGQQLESIGRISIDRIGQNAQALAALIDNSDRGIREIGAVSVAAKENMEQLRGQLPVIASAAKDVASQIGNAGRGAEAQLTALAGGFDRLQAASGSAQEQMARLEALTEQTATALERLTSGAVAQADQAASSLDESARLLAERLQKQFEALSTDLDGVSDRIDARAVQSRTQMDQTVHALESSLSGLKAMAEEVETRIQAVTAAVDGRLADARDTLGTLDSQGSDTLAKLAFALEALEKNVQALSQHFEAGTAHTEVFLASAGSIQSSLERSREALETTLPRALAALSSNTEASQGQVGELAAQLESIRINGDVLSELLTGIASQTEAQEAEMARLVEGTTLGWDRQAKQIGALIKAMRDAREEAVALADGAGARLSETLRDVQREAAIASQDVRRALDRAIRESMEQLDSETSETLEALLTARAEELGTRLSALIDRTVNAANEAATTLDAKLARVDQLTSLLEQRIADARQQAEGESDQDFARRVALLTESLNSLSIDIARTLGTDVADTAWAAYLKGDRGVFTRRAVRLLASGESKDIAQAYRNEPAFYDQVNRYVHDFEAMLRNLLSTRDGGAMAVTLLSSDMGKLYVALAQAIERFRR